MRTLTLAAVVLLPLPFLSAQEAEVSQEKLAGYCFLTDDDGRRVQFTATWSEFYPEAGGAKLDAGFREIQCRNKNRTDNWDSAGALDLKVMFSKNGQYYDRVYTAYVTQPGKVVGYDLILPDAETGETSMQSVFGEGVALRFTPLSQDGKIGGVRLSLFDPAGKLEASRDILCPEQPCRLAP